MTPDLIATFTATIEGVAYQITYEGEYDEGFPRGGHALYAVNITRMVDPAGELIDINAGDGQPRPWQLATTAATLDMMNRVLEPVPLVATSITVDPRRPCPWITPSAKILDELDRRGLTAQEKTYALSTVHRFIGYAVAWLDVDQPGIRPVATLAAILASVRALEAVTRASNPALALRTTLEALPS